MTLKVVIYSDGGSKPNPGPGGWGALVITPHGEHELSGGELNTTNNRMELTAACEALESLPQGCEVTLYTDSTYVKNGITKWIQAWLKKDWQGSKGEPVANQELWQRLHAATRRHKLKWEWVRGHSGNVYNERVDRLATQARARLTGEHIPDLPDTPAGVTPPAKDEALYLMVNMGADKRSARWGAVITTAGGAQTTLNGRLTGITSENQALLQAALALLEAIPPEQAHITWTVYTPSEYLQKGASSWVKGWIKNGWKTASKQPVKYREQWERLHTLTTERRLEWVYLPANKPLMQSALLASQT